MAPRPHWLLYLLPLAILAHANVAHAAARGNDDPEDAFLEGDFDREDLGHLINGGAGSGRRTGASDLRGETWISVVAFGGRDALGRDVVGGMAMVGIAFDRIATGPVHQIDARPYTYDGLMQGGLPLPPSPPPPAKGAPAPEAPLLLLTGKLARDTVSAAWRAAGLGTDDSRIDEIVSRARLSAALPETRLRALKQVSSGSQVDGSIDDSRYYDTIGSGLWLEARVTWRLDRLLYADDEPTLERVRLERADARLRLATHVMDSLIAWQRAVVDVATAPVGSRDALGADLRRLEAEAMLDVLTAGKFRVLTTSPGKR